MRCYLHYMGAESSIHRVVQRRNNVSSMSGARSNLRQKSGNIAAKLGVAGGSTGAKSQYGSRAEVRDSLIEEIQSLKSQIAQQTVDHLEEKLLQAETHAEMNVVACHDDSHEQRVTEIESDLKAAREEVEEILKTKEDMSSKSEIDLLLEVEELITKKAAEHKEQTIDLIKDLQVQKQEYFVGSKTNNIRRLNHEKQAHAECMPQRQEMEAQISRESAARSAAKSEINAIKEGKRVDSNEQIHKLEDQLKTLKVNKAKHRVQLLEQKIAELNNSSTVSGVPVNAGHKNVLASKLKQAKADLERVSE